MPGLDSIAARISAVDGFIVCPPSTTVLPTKPFEELLVPRPGSDGHDARLEIAGAQRRREPLLALPRLLVHVGELGLEDLAERGTERERSVVVVRMHMHLERGGVADDEERIADLSELAFEPLCVQIVPRDDEGRAVAVARELLVDRVDPEGVACDLDRRDLLAGHTGREPAHDLEQARAAGIDDTGLAKLVEQLGRPRDGLLATSDDPARNSSGASACTSGCSPSSAISRMTVRIVPSTGARRAP